MEKTRLLVLPNSTLCVRVCLMLSLERWVSAGCAPRSGEAAVTADAITSRTVDWESEGLGWRPGLSIY